MKEDLTGVGEGGSKLKLKGIDDRVSTPYSTVVGDLLVWVDFGGRKMVMMEMVVLRLLCWRN